MDHFCSSKVFSVDVVESKELLNAKIGDTFNLLENVFNFIILLKLKLQIDKIDFFINIFYKWLITAISCK